MFFFALSSIPLFLLKSPFTVTLKLHSPVAILIIRKTRKTVHFCHLIYFVRSALSNVTKTERLICNNINQNKYNKHARSSQAIITIWAESLKTARAVLFCTTRQHDSTDIVLLRCYYINYVMQHKTPQGKSEKTMVIGRRLS